MKLLVVGCGSIGRRHARNARKLGLDVVLCDISQERLHELSAEIGAVGVFTDYQLAARESGADAALIATPSHLHVAPASAMLAAGMHVMMEKPLCPSIAEAKALKHLVVESKRIFMMAHTFRFRAEWQAIKRLLDTQPVGRVFSAEFMGGWYLPDWHFREDYRQEYAAQRRQGGGVMLTSMSHFFDVVSWFFGEIQGVVGAKMRLSPLDIDVDDAVMCSVRTEGGVAVTLCEDFLARCPRRTFRVNGEHGYLEADFNRKSLRLWDARAKRYLPGADPAKEQEGLFRILEDGVGYDPEPDVLPLEYSGNDAYLAEMEHFAALVDRNCMEPELGIDAGIKVLEAIGSAGIVDWTNTGTN
ncbi:Gfo/Idh/MocA family protein [Denitromonas halophila]|uniref:Gfo/Idh/MocA family oxidoreductase n=1 Tax=Denitromonas halophila TaxID=1629404 RepID=A0A557QN58_9RHOO|nr:Gfo/Idh/MocA family oxidoreductase [Denitromonas halophila]TVO54352.1 Gfo/Idh/MocA family oxidoreductase [Denitromonas halophila]